MQWHLWYFGKVDSPSPEDDLCTALAKVNATPHWHDADEVFHALPSAKQRVMLAAQEKPNCLPRDTAGGGVRG